MVWLKVSSRLRTESADQGSTALHHYALNISIASCREQAVSAAADAVSSLQYFASFLAKQKRKSRDYNRNKIAGTGWVGIAGNSITENSIAS